MRDDAWIFRIPILEYFFHSWQALSNISPHGSGASSVEGPHGELSSWFTDSLSSYGAHCFTHVYYLIPTEISAITMHANPFESFTRERIADLQCIHTNRFYNFSIFVS